MAACAASTSCGTGARVAQWGDAERPQAGERATWRTWRLVACLSVPSASLKRRASCTTRTRARLRLLSQDAPGRDGEGGREGGVEGGRLGACSMPVQSFSCCACCSACSCSPRTCGEKANTRARGRGEGGGSWVLRKEGGGYAKDAPATLPVARGSHPTSLRVPAWWWRRTAKAAPASTCCSARARRAPRVALFGAARRPLPRGRAGQAPAPAPCGASPAHDAAPPSGPPSAASAPWAATGGAASTAWPGRSTAEACRAGTA